MKWTVCFLLFAMCACKKNLTEEQQVENAQQRIVGKWKLIQYYRDKNDGTGEWVPADGNNIQIIEFMRDGKFSHNENFQIQTSIDSYKFLGPHKVLLFSSFSSDSAKYEYPEQHGLEMIFNPLCMEFSCMRKWSRIE